MSAENEPDPLVAPRGDDPVQPSDPGDGFESAAGADEPRGSLTEREDAAPASEVAATYSSEPPVERVSEPAPRAEDGGRRSRRGRAPNMLPGRDHRSEPERLLVRMIATGGIVGIGVAIAAIMQSSGSQGWIIGLVVSIVTVLLAALLWSSRVL